MLRLGLAKALHGTGGHYRKTDSGSRQDGDSDGQKSGGGPERADRLCGQERSRLCF